MAAFAHLEPRPADALLGLMAAFRADPRADKIDLGVGVYRNEAGKTPIMSAVKKAESVLAETGDTKIYEGPRGNVAFCEAIEQMVFGDAADADTHLSFSTPGGCGALFLANCLAKRTAPAGRFWMSDPTWANHPAIAKNAGLDVATYPYANPASPDVRTDAMLAKLEEAKAGDTVLFQGPCHNPTGIDLSQDDWVALGELCERKGLLPLIDIAYHGFANSLGTDLLGVQAFLARVPDTMISYSCSKNFGLYRERTGALLIKAATPKAAQSVHTHVADIARTAYSMPPAHGQAIVATIMADPALCQEWQTELVAMQARMADLRRALADALQPRTNTYDPAALCAQNGMFSQLPFVEGGVDALREQGVYIPGSGRINIAGLTTEQIPGVAASMSPYL